MGEPLRTSTRTRDLAPIVALAAALAVGAVLRLWGIGWDENLGLHPDEGNLVRGAMRLDLAWGTNPGFHAYGGLALFGPRLLTQAWNFLDPAVDPRAPHLVAMAARWISAAASIGTIALGALTMAVAVEGREGRIAAAAAAWLLALDVGMIQAAHFGTTDAPLVFVLACLAAFAAALLRGKLSPALWTILSGAVLGLGLALKASALIMALVPASAALLAFRRFGFGGLLVSGLAGVAIALATFALASPHSLLFLDDFLATMRFETGVVNGTVDVFWTLQFTNRPAYFAFAQMPWMNGPLVPGLGIAGLAVVLIETWRGDRQARALAPLALYGAFYLAYVWTLHAAFIRYLLPASLFLPVGAIWLMRALMPRHGGTARGIWGAGAVVLFAVSLAWSIAFTAIYRNEDSRIRASRWLGTAVRSGDVLLLEPNDNGLPTGVANLPPLQRRVLPLLEPDGPDLSKRFAEDIAAADWIVLATRRNWGVLPRLGARFPVSCAYYRALFGGALGFELAARFENQPKLTGLTIPTGGAEETFEVFDHPTTLIFRRDRPLDAASIAATLDRDRGDCDRGRPPRP